MRATILVVLFCLPVHHGASAQGFADSSATMSSLRRAHAVLTRGIAAMGGLEALQALVRLH